ncbi:hypothetical protein [Epilithonimonas hominis]|uniref:hypothetical protein n=1 Tax=Epilithonimonas hominis TaxID=420404 RepID=UPI00289CE2BD|nr:hypothetical protein [Epilithonimonas hominis]
MIKTNPTVKFEQFLSLVKELKAFKSKTGKVYKIISLDGSILSFLRETGEEWKIELRKVHQAYLELQRFKTIDFKPYVPRRQSPALGLLLAVGLLKN